LKHFIVPEAQHQIAACFESACAGLIFPASLDVLSAIDFDNQTRRFTAKVHDVPIDWHLATEFPSAESAVPQPEP
jgi:hypothetical protein